MLSFGTPMQGKIHLAHAFITATCPLFIAYASNSPNAMFSVTSAWVVNLNIGTQLIAKSWHRFVVDDPQHCASSRQKLKILALWSYRNLSYDRL